MPYSYTPSSVRIFGATTSTPYYYTPHCLHPTSTMASAKGHNGEIEEIDVPNLQELLKETDGQS